MEHQPSGSLRFRRQLEETMLGCPETRLWEEFTYRDLDRMLETITGRLWDLGLAVRDRAAICCRDPFRSLVLALALCRYGATLVLLDPALPGAQRSRLLDQTQAGILFTEDPTPEPGERLPCCAVEPGLPRLNRCGIPPAASGDPEVMAIFCAPDSPPETVTYGTVAEAAASGRFLTDLPFYGARGFVGIMAHVLGGSTLRFGGAGELPDFRPGAAAFADCEALASALRSLEASRWELGLLRGLIRRCGYAPAGRLRKLTAPVLGGNLRAIGGESRENQAFFRELGLSWLDLGEKGPDNKVM